MDSDSKAAVLEALNRACDELYRADWEDPNGPIRLSSDLSLADLAGGPVLQNARIFLQMLEVEPAATTEKGNLSRSFVRSFFDRMQLPARARETILAVNKVLNETDVGMTHQVRVLCETAGLIQRRHKQFHITKKGRAYLPEAKAGELFRLLFVTLFRKINLAYLSTTREVPAVQDTAAISLWRLSGVAERWVPVSGLEQHILPDIALRKIRAQAGPIDDATWVLRSYLLWPLEELGLVEFRPPGPYASESQEVRITDLWRKFLQFRYRLLYALMPDPGLN